MFRKQTFSTIGALVVAGLISGCAGNEGRPKQAMDGKASCSCEKGDCSADKKCSGDKKCSSEKCSNQGSDCDKQCSGDKGCGAESCGGK